MWITDWSERAACKGTDPDELFVFGAAQHRAKLICRGCPVRTECLADALDYRIEFGVWGGMTERERSALLRRRPDVTSWRDLLETARDQYESAGTVAAAIRSSTVVAEFEACYKAEYTRVVMFLIKQGHSPQDAADAAQVAFTEAYEHWETIKTPRAWLRRVALRSLKRRPEHPVEVLPIKDQSSWRDGLDGLELRQQTRDVLEALQQLPPMQRAVMAWTYDGFEPTEIANELGCEAAAVRKNLQRAREKLKVILVLGSQEEDR